MSDKPENTGRIHRASITMTSPSLPQAATHTAGLVVGATEGRYLDVRYTVF